MCNIWVYFVFIGVYLSVFEYTWVKRRTAQIALKTGANSSDSET
jgi:hypothetical protein